MADIVSDAVAAPKKALDFGKNNVLALLVLVLVLAVLFVAAESKSPGSVRNKVARIPLLGEWALRAGP